MSEKQGVKLRSAEKLARIPIKVVQLAEPLKKPEWIKVKLPSGENFNRVKKLLREHKLHTVCEEASCPNIGECFNHGTATFMIMGDICTRRCPFCDVGHGVPNSLDSNEPSKVAQSVEILGLRYVVITSVDRDDLRDGGASHFAQCITEIRKISPHTKIEILVPDFRGRLDKALDILVANSPDVLNHNLETVPRLYKSHRPGADLMHSLGLLQRYKQMAPLVSTKSGIMLGLGETQQEIKDLMYLMREHAIEMITIGQYLQPSKHHAPVLRYATPEEFKELETYAYSLGFKHAAVGALVRSSYHADLQAQNAGVVE